VFFELKNSQIGGISQFPPDPSFSGEIAKKFRGIGRGFEKVLEIMNILIFLNKC
jgi:hypothetical protein